MALTGLLGLAAAAAMPPVPAHAVSLFGVCLFGECPDEKAQAAAEIIDPHFFELEVIVTPDDVAGVVRGASSLVAADGGPLPGAAGIIARAKGDYRRILAALYDTGRYGPTISIRIEGREAADLKVGAELPNNSRVVIEVEPGPTYEFGTAEIANQAPPPVDYDDIVDLPADEGFAPGQPARATVVRRAGKLAVEAWREQGHPKARVAGREASAIHPDRYLNVRVDIEPGPAARFGDVFVTGTERMDPDFVAYMTALPRGQEYDPDAIRRARVRLDRLGVFSTRRLEEGAVGDDGLMPVEVIVQERKLRRIGAGATASTLDGFGAEGYWLHRNLFGRAESLRLEASMGGFGTNFDADIMSSLDYGLAATFRKPGIFTPDTDLVLNAFARRETNETYTEEAVGGSALIDHFLTEQITLRYGAKASAANVEDAFGERDFVTIAALGEGTFDFRDDRLDPTEGTYFYGKVEPFHELRFGNTGVRLEAEARAYADFGTDGRSIVAGRLKIGSLFGSDIDETSPDQLFLTGGGGSLRGYAYRSVGVERSFPDGDETVGGRGLIEGSIEFRQRFGKSFGGVAFVDAATVSEDSFATFDEDVRVGVGVGFRYYTGLGPIRLDVAVPLNPGDDDGSYGIYAGIGHAF